jgi:hypothetical protein
VQFLSAHLHPDFLQDRLVRDPAYEGQQWQTVFERDMYNGLLNGRMSATKQVYRDVLVELIPTITFCGQRDEQKFPSRQRLVQRRQRVISENCQHYRSLQLDNLNRHLAGDDWWRFSNFEFSPSVPYRGRRESGHER